MRKGIRTEYAVQQFRSRLEATWAAFFDLAGWPWIYEPFDLASYIPDFVLRFGRQIVTEIKPALTLEELHGYTPKLEHCGWSGSMLMLGASPVLDIHAAPGLSAFALMARNSADGIGWDPAALAVRGDRLCIVRRRSWRANAPERERVTQLWRQAQNRTQWRAA